MAGELSAEKGLRFEDYKGAMRNLLQMELVGPDAVAKLERLPGFRNVLVHEYVELELERVLDALDELQPVAKFCRAVHARFLAESNG